MIQKITRSYSLFVKCFVLIALSTVVTFSASAFKQVVMVSNYQFTPANFTINLGDSVQWVLSTSGTLGSHTTTSTSIPAGAAAWNSPISPNVVSFLYVPGVVGTYNYVSNETPAVQMAGQFTVVCPSIKVSIVLNGGISNSQISICDGSRVTLTASASGGVKNPFGTELTYQWLSGTATIPGETNSSYTTGAAGTYSVVAKNSCGNSGASQTVTVIISPSVVSINAQNTTICKGGCTSLTASSTPGTGVIYKWSPAAGLNLTTGATVTACPTINTTYTVVASSTSGCTATSTVAITVNDKPVVVGVAKSYTICKGSSTTLTATGSTSYLWSPGAGVSATTGSSVIASPSVSTTYTVFGGSTVGGCYASDTVKVNVINVEFIIQPQQPVVCPGSCTQLTASGFSGATYSWSPSGGISSGATINACPTVTTTYTVTGTTVNGCTGSATVVVYVSTSASIKVNPTESTICTGNCVSLTASGGSSYAWKPAAGLSVTTGATVNACPTTTTTYTVTSTNPTGGCTGTATSVVIVTQKPNVTGFTSKYTICKGSSTVLSATGASTFSWSPSTGLSAVTGSQVTASPTVTTVYTVTGYTSTNSSGFAGCYGVDTVRVNVTNVEFAVGPQQPVICPGSCVTLSVSAPVPNNIVSYAWSPAAGLSATTGASVTACPTIKTTYIVTATTSNGCTAIAYTVVNLSSAISIGVTVPQSPICVGSCVSLTASGGGLYAWSPATGLSVTTGATVNACPSVTTTYTVTSSITGGCSGSATVVVEVVSKPNVTGVASPYTICNGSSSKLSATGATNYYWSPSTGLSAVTGANVLASPTVTTVYTVTGVNSNGTSGTSTCYSTDTVRVNVVVAGFAIIPQQQVVCPGNCVQLSVSDPISNNIVSYKWSPATGLSVTSGMTVSACPTVTTTYTAVGTTAQGCTVASTVVVTVSSKVAVKVTPSESSVCLGNCTQLTASTDPLVNYLFVWSPSAGLSATTGSVVTACPTITTTYTVSNSVTGSGCAGSATAVVIVGPKVNIKGVASSYTICKGSSTNLSATGGTNYYWSPSAGLSGVTGANVTASPTITTTYTVTGYNANGGTGTTSPGCYSSDTVVVNVISISAGVSPRQVSVCPGNCVKLTATGGLLGGVNTALSFAWSPSAGLSATTGSVVTACPKESTTYTVTVIGAAGCTASATVVISVSLTSQLVVSPSSVSICAGTCTQLSVPAVTGNIYSWSPAAGLSATTGSTVTACPTATTTYTVTTVPGASGCAGSATAVVTVNPKPTVTGIAKSYTICKGSSTTLSATGGLSYYWSPGAGLSAVTGSEVIASPTVSTTYTVIGFNASGTPTNSCYSSDTVKVNVINTEFKVTPQNAVICAGSCTQLSVSSSTPNSIFTYKWSPTAGLSVSTGASVLACPTVTTTYTVVGVSTNGCSGSATTTVVIGTPPNVVGTASQYTICLGSSTKLSATGAINYYWSPAAGLSAVTGANVAASPSVSTTYTVIGYNTNGAGSTACYSKDTVQITVGPFLEKGFIQLASGSLSFCLGGNAVLQAFPAGMNYQWLKNSAAIAGATNVNYTATDGGNYSCIISNSCGAFTSNVLKVIRLNTPNPVISADALSTVICHTDSVKLVCTTSADWSSQWSLNGGDIDGATTNVYEAKAAGNYRYLATSLTTGCSRLSNTIKVSYATNCREEGSTLENGVSVYPNPFSDVLNIDLQGEQNVTVNLYNILGKKIYSVENASGIVTINSKLNDGVYIAEVKKGSKVLMIQKVVKTE